MLLVRVHRLASLSLCVSNSLSTKSCSSLEVTRTTTPWCPALPVEVFVFCHSSCQSAILCSFFINKTAIEIYSFEHRSPSLSVHSTLSAMCIYHTYHWSCCPGTSRPAPYYMHMRCIKATQPKPHGVRLGKEHQCHIEFRFLDGCDYEEPCPNCGAVTLDEEEERLFEREVIG